MYHTNIYEKLKEIPFALKICVSINRTGKAPGGEGK
jgi:hypothetical protein